MKFTAIVLSLIALFAMPARADDGVAGQWSGTWTKNGDALPVTVTFAKGDTMEVEVLHHKVRFDTYSGSFDSDGLQASGIPFAQVVFATSKIHFELVGDETATMFDGALAGDVLSGTFQDGKDPGVFRLTRVAEVVAAPASREVTFANGNLKLAGTMLLPGGPGRHPAIVFLHGSGAEGRWANHWLARKFVERGFVALIYDKRGVGQSSGDWQTANFDDLAADAVAAIRFAQAQPEVDPRRIGIYGHSQGGTIAPLVAERAGDVAFVIAASGSGLKPVDLERYSVGNSMGIPSLTGSDKADAEGFLNEILDVAFNGKDRAALDAMSIKLADRPWYFELPSRTNSYWAFSHAIADYRPLDHWRRVRAPVLLVFGARDARVPAKESTDAIERALRSAGNRRVARHTYPDANHTFIIVDPPPPAGTWPKREPDYATVLTEWALSVL